MVVVAEMGDKTQLIAMAFGAKYKASQVLWGVFIGALLNHGLAVLLGTFLGEYISLDFLGLAAGALFLVFGVMALKPDKDEDEDGVMSRFGPIATVALTFFLGEMGDKTQLTVLSMAMQYRAPLSVLGGAVTGMMVADSPGVLVGDMLLKRIPPKAIKFGSAAVFIGFGMVTLFEHLGSSLRTWLILAGAAVAVALGAWYILRAPQPAAGERRSDEVA
jgi:putative Ca2+/H+ antiporter (TMEM165/GDT1 family)